MFFRTVPEHKMRLPTAEEALPGRAEPMVTSEIHAVLGTRIQPPFPGGLQQLVVGMGCFWGAERLFWQLDGVYSTAVGYSAGLTPNPTYEEVCSGLTGHNEVVLVVFDPDHHGDCSGRGILLCRGLPSAVPAQESGWILRHRRHRSLHEVIVFYLRIQRIANKTSALP